MAMDDWLTRTRSTLLLRAWSFSKVPLLHWIKPSILALSEERVVISIPLGRRQKNHLGSLYFGVLACGADVAGGLLAVKQIQASGENVSLIFKDFNAQFLKRAEGTTHFTCEDGPKISSLVAEALTSGKRVSRPVTVVATCPQVLGDEPVAIFKLTLSLRKASTTTPALWQALRKRLPSF